MNSSTCAVWDPLDAGDLCHLGDDIVILNNKKHSCSPISSSTVPLLLTLLRYYLLASPWFAFSTLGISCIQQALRAASHGWLPTGLTISCIAFVLNHCHSATIYVKSLPSWTLLLPLPFVLGAEKRAADRLPLQRPKQRRDGDRRGKGDDAPGACCCCAFAFACGVWPSLRPLQKHQRRFLLLLLTTAAVGTYAICVNANMLAVWRRCFAGRTGPSMLVALYRASVAHYARWWWCLFMRFVAFLLAGYHYLAPVRFASRV